MMTQKPSVGRIVHFHSGLEEKPFGPFAAIITEVIEPAAGVVALTVFYPNGWQLVPVAVHHATPKGGHWTWPPKV